MFFFRRKVENCDFRQFFVNWNLTYRDKLHKKPCFEENLGTTVADFFDGLNKVADYRSFG